MTPNRQRFIEELKLHGLSANTIEVYVRAVRKLAECFKMPPSQLSDEDLRGYLLHLRYKPVAVSTYNVTVVAIQRFFKYCVPQRPAPRINQIPTPFTLPEVLSAEEVKRFLDCVTNIKYKTIFSLIYSAGLRISECASLRLSDIDSRRMLLHVRAAKGNRDRYVTLGKVALELLYRYYQACKPREYLFESGVKKGNPIHIRSIQKVFRRAVKDAGITKTVRPHTLRHSFATHLLDQKCPLPAIQQLLGHKCIKSTLIYTHISPKTLADIVNPLDALKAVAAEEASDD